MTRTLRVLLCLLYCSLSLHAQETHVQKALPNILSGKDFLGEHSDINVYDIAIDSNGYAFFVGPDGLFRFNGFEAIPLAIDSNLRHVPLRRIFKGQRQRLWVTCGKGIGVIDGDSLKRFPLPDSIEKLLHIGVESLHVDKFGTLHLAPKLKGYFTVTLEGKVTPMATPALKLDGVLVTHLADGTPFHFSLRTSGEMRSLYYMDGQGNISLIAETSEKVLGHNSDLVEHSDGSLTVSIGLRTLIRFRPDGMVFKKIMDDEVFKLFLDSKEHLWIGTVSSGALEALDDSLTQFSQHFSGAIAAVAQDAFGGIWFNAYRLGFGYMSPTFIPHLSDRNGFSPFGSILKVMGGNNTIFCVTLDHKLYTLSGDTIRKVPGSDNALECLHRFPRHSACYDQKRNKLWIADPGMLLGWDGKSWEKTKLSQFTDPNRVNTSLNVLDDGSLLGSTFKRVFTYKDGRLSIISDPHRYIRSVAMDAMGKIWVAASDGLWLLEDRKMVRPPINMPKELRESAKVVEYALESIWVAGESGFFRVTEGSVQKITAPDGLPVIVNALSQAPNGTLWAMSKKEVSSLLRISVDGNEAVFESFQFDDLAADNVLDEGFMATDDQIYLGGPFGLFMTSIADLKKDTRQERSWIKEVRINHQRTANKKSHSLKHEQNTINLEFGAVSYRRIPLQFRYRMVGLDSAWYSSDYGRIQYTNLDPGEYRFMLQSRIKGTTWGETNETLFFIATPYWETFWFKTLVALAFLLAIISAFQLRSRSIQKREQYKSKVALEMARLELKAVKAQLNPHFIFNSISSVMYYLQKNRAEDAQRYMQKFSMIIRSVLDNSEKTSVALSQELDLMRHYVSLESERFLDSNLEFEVAIHDIDTEQATIPPALFQPYIENAIWHGLQHKKGQRKLLLEVRKEGNLMRIVIEDNGIGRKGSAKKETSWKKERSYGMMIASRRIEALLTGELQNILTEDLVDKNGAPLGTRVSFYLPLVDLQNKALG